MTERYVVRYFSTETSEYKYKTFGYLEDVKSFAECCGDTERTLIYQLIEEIPKNQEK